MTLTAIRPAAIDPAPPTGRCDPALVEKSAGAGKRLGPRQLAWCRENILRFDDAEKRAREVIADTERLRRESGRP